MRYLRLPLLRASSDSIVIVCIPFSANGLATILSRSGWLTTADPSLAHNHLHFTGSIRGTDRAKTMRESAGGTVMPPPLVRMYRYLPVPGKPRSVRVDPPVAALAPRRLNLPASQPARQHSSSRSKSQRLRGSTCLLEILR